MTSELLINATRERVAAVLKAKFPNFIDFGDGSFAVPHGSSSVAVLVRSYTETDTMVELIAQIVSGANVTPDVMHWLLRKNAELHFGAFGLLFDNTIVYTYSIPGVHLDSEELESAITSVAVIADHYDDEIVNMAGGKRASDL
jgi:hypothetical protein